MNNRQSKRISVTLNVMLFVTLFLAAGTILYLSYSSTTEEALRNDKNIIPLNGPWKFKVGDNSQYSQAGYDDSKWENIDLTAPPGAHDDDVGLSGFIPGWTEKGHANYSGYAWYRLKVPIDNLQGNNLALAAPPAVDDAYQLFVNGVLVANTGDFSGKVPIVYSIRPSMFLLPESVKKGKDLTIAFRVWMSAASLTPGAGGIHIAPAIGEKTHIDKKYRFQWEQTIKGYIVEVVLPVMFVLLAASIFLLHNSAKRPRSCKWFVIALILVGLLRFNQAFYYWFQIENADQSTILGTAVIRPLMLGSWLMAWREWFDLHQPKWLPKFTVILVVLYMVIQVLGLLWVSNSLNHAYYDTVSAYIRLLLLASMLFTAYQAIRKEGAKGGLVFLALLLLIIALYPQEISELKIIPGIWFPYGVGVSRGQFCYAGFVLMMYGVLIQKSRESRVG